MDLAESIGLTVIDRSADGNSPVLEEGEEVLHTFSAVQLIIGSDAEQGSGKLYITEGRILWLSAEDARRAYAVEFPAITMHAIATDPETVQRPCLYVQLEQDEDDVADLEDEEEAPPLPELRFIPADTAELDPMFAAFCAGAERNPDADAEEGQGSFFFDQDEVLAGAAGAALGVDDVDELVGGDPERFEDPDDEEEEEGAHQQPQNGPPSSER